MTSNAFVWGAAAVAAAVVVQLAIMVLLRRIRPSDGFIRPQLLSFAAGLVTVLALSIAWSLAWWWPVVVFTTYWTWQVFVASAVEKSLTLRLLVLLSNAPDRDPSEVMQQTLADEFVKRAGILEAGGVVVPVVDGYRSVPTSRVKVGEVDRFLIRLFKVRIGNLY